MPEKTSPINDLKPNRFPRKKGLTGNRPNKVKEISEENSNDMTDYPIGDGKEYPSNSNMHYLLIASKLLVHLSNLVVLKTFYFL